jgi:CDP-diacylglycerol--glycerol-3-phosphate 3-phosphatidyltransferase
MESSNTPQKKSEHSAHSAIESNRQLGRLWMIGKLTSFLGAITCLVLNYRIWAVSFLLVSLLMGFYASFRLRQEDIEKPLQKFWFSLFEKTLANILFWVLLLTTAWSDYDTFPTLLLVGCIAITLRNLFYLGFSITLMREEKKLPLNSIWGKLTTAVMNITMILYALPLEQSSLKLWTVEVHSLSNTFMVLSLLLISATVIGYLYFYYRDPDHRKPISVATQITMSRIILSPVFIWVFFYDNNLNYEDNNLIFQSIALLMVIFFAISDGLDGYMARKLGEVSKLGKYLDPFSDKVSNMSVFLCFLASGYANIWMIALIYFREASIETLRTLAAGENVVIDARKSGKWKTGIQMGATITILVGALASSIFSKYFPDIYTSWKLIWEHIPYTLMTIVTLVTVLSGIDYITGNLKTLKKFL